MKSLNLSEEELLSMSYDDVAYKVLEHREKKMKIQDLFKEVIRIMNLPESAFEDHLADFFELLSTDKDNPIELQRKEFITINKHGEEKFIIPLNDYLKAGHYRLVAGNMSADFEIN